MSIARAIDRYLDALTYARAALASPGVLAPFAIFSALQALILLALASFTLPLIAPVMVPVLRFLGGEQALHYPMHLVGLPSVYQRVYLPLVATVGFTLWSIAVWKLAERHPVGADRTRFDVRPSFRDVVIIGVLFVGASVVAGELASRLVSPRTPDVVQRAILFGSVLVTAVMQAFLVYAPLVLRIRGGNAWQAIRAGVTYGRKRFAETVLVIFTVLLIHLPVDFLLSRADRLAARFEPETVLYTMLGSVVLEMFTAYLLFAGITELALPREGGIR
jgi:hypothetical protein